MADELRARIVAGAADFLRESGLRGFSMEAAALRSGVSRKTVYNYFSSRFELLDVIFETSVKGTIATLAAISADPGLDFSAKLNAMTEEGFRRVREGSRLFRDGGGTSLHPRPAELYRELRRSLAGFIMGIVEEASGLGLIRPGFEPLRLTHVIINMVEGLLYLDDPEDEPFSRLDILQESLRAVLGGILSPAGMETLRGFSLMTRSEDSK